MSWRYWNRRRRREGAKDDEDSDSFYDPFDFDFRFGFKEIDELIDNMLKAARAQGGEMTSIGPVYYGYSVTTDPDGKPHVREFGNVRPTRRGTFELGSREPFIDIVVDEKENQLKIVAEMPGVQREDIKLQVMEDSVNIKAEHGDRKYETTVPLTQEVNPNTSTATYNNGVLEIKVKLKGSSVPKGVSVKID